MRYGRGAFLAWTLGLTTTCAYGCGHRGSADPSLDAGHASTVSASTPHASRNVALDMIADFDACTLGYRGTLLDLGDPTSRARVVGRQESGAVETVEREGATWARVRARSLTLSYYAAADDNPATPGSDVALYIEMRVRGLAARTVTVYLDGKAIGAAPLPKGEAAVVSFRGSSPPPGEGLHEIHVRFAGAPRGASDAMAEIDWIHVGDGEPEPHYAAPTRTDTLTNTTFAGEPLPAIALRAPGFVRCEGWIPKGATVETTILPPSEGQAVAQVRLLRDRVEPVVLGSVTFTPQDRAPKRVSWPVGDLGGDTGGLAAIELVAVSAPKGARLLFGAPRVVVAERELAADAGTRLAARGVVLVVLGELSTRSLSLYGGSRPVPELAALAAQGITFEANRATSGQASSTFASLLTGRTPHEHTLDDHASRLPRSITTIADAARQAGIATALFTANPTTGAAFGFDRGWTTFESDGPNDDGPAVTVFDHAAQWLDAHKGDRFLVVIHARGGHPPWDVTADQLKTLEPENYTGGLDAKHAAELLGRARAIPGSFRWNDADRERAWALHALAVDAHDAAIGRLVQALRAAGRDGDTAVFVTGDAAVNLAAHIPFADAETLDEPSLWTPLVVRLPGSPLAGLRVDAPTSALDVGRTVLATLGLEPPSSFGGMDLLDVARGGSPPSGRPMAATVPGRFAVRWDRYVLYGSRDRETKLCDVALEPSCVTDVRPTYPLALDVLHRATFDAFAPGEPAPAREPATLDATTSAALRAWGR